MISRSYYAEDMYVPGASLIVDTPTTKTAVRYSRTREPLAGTLEKKIKFQANGNGFPDWIWENKGYEFLYTLREYEFRSITHRKNGFVHTATDTRIVTAQVVGHDHLYCLEQDKHVLQAANRNNNSIFVRKDTYRTRSAWLEAKPGERTKTFEHRLVPHYLNQGTILFRPKTTSIKGLDMLDWVARNGQLYPKKAEKDRWFSPDGDLECLVLHTYLGRPEFYQPK